MGSLLKWLSITFAVTIVVVVPSTPARTSRLNAQATKAAHHVKQYTIEQFRDTTSIFGSSFSADEAQVMFTSNKSGIFNAYTVPVSGGEAAPLTHSTKESTFGIGYFPHDNRILYTYDRGGNENNHLYVMGTDGQEKDLTPGDKVKANFLKWTFDGDAFYYTVIDAISGQVTVRYTDDGKEKVLSERLELPPDVANGILFTLLKNVQRSVPRTMVSYVAATPKPRLVSLEIIPQGQKPFSIGSYSHKAIHYVVKVKIGGVAGLVAHLVGKQPPDTQAWVLADDAPAFVRSDGPLYGDGPIWRMELAIPAVWPDSTAAVRSHK